MPKTKPAPTARTRRLIRSLNQAAGQYEALELIPLTDPERRVAAKALRWAKGLACRATSDSVWWHEQMRDTIRALEDPDAD